MAQKETWGDFEVEFSPEGLIGEGGFSCVYRARQVSLDRKVALKVFDPSAQNHPAAVLRELLVRVQNEGRVLARLKHPNITDVISAGEKEGRLYIAMEYVDGENLAQYLGRHTQADKRIEGRDIMRIASAVVAALKAAYNCVADDGQASRIIHRDVKPSNILIGRRGQVKMTDFGLARIVALPPGTGRPATRAKPERVTRFGSEIGTPHYMSPEAFGGLENVDHRSDIYSLGCVLFEIIAKKPPFSGEWEDLRKRHSEEAPELPAQAVPHVPASLVTLVMRCLEKHPQMRFQTYDEVEKALQEIEKELAAPALENVPMQVHPTRSRLSSRRVLSLVLVGLVAIAAAWALRANNNGGPTPPHQPPQREDGKSQGSANDGKSANENPPQESNPEKQVNKQAPDEQRPATPPANREPAPSEKPVTNGMPSTPSLVLMARMFWDMYTAIVEYGIVQQRAEASYSAHRTELLARRYENSLAALQQLVQEQKGKRFGSQAAQWEHERVAQADQIVGSFVKSIRKSEGSEISIHLKNGTTARGTLQKCDESLGEMRIRSGGEVRTVGFLSVAASSLCADRQPADRAAFLWIDGLPLQALSEMMSLQGRDQRAWYFQPRLAADAIAACMERVRSDEAIDDARLLVDLVDRHPALLGRLPDRVRKSYRMLHEEVEAEEALKRGDEQAVFKRFPGTSAFRKACRQLYAKLTGDKQGWTSPDLFDEDRWEFSKPKDVPLPTVENYDADLLISQPEGPTLARYTDSDWTKGLDVTFSFKPAQGDASVAVILDLTPEREVRFGYDVAAGELVLRRQLSGKKEEILAREKIAAMDLSKGARLVMLRRFDRLLFFADGRLFSTWDSSELALDKNIRISVLNGAIRVRDLRVRTE